MSDAIKNIQVMPAAERPPVEHGTGHKQQWRLALEKAYLAAARDKKADRSAVHAEKAAVVVDAAGNSGPSDLQPPRVQAASASGAVSDSIKELVEYSCACADFAAELESGGFERFMAKLLAGAGMIFTPSMQDPGVKTLYITRAVTHAADYKSEFRDKSLLLLPSAEGLQLIIRDAEMTADLLSRMILKLRDIFNDRGMRLARVMVNGAELWKEQEPGVETDSEDFDGFPGLINKIY